MGGLHPPVLWLLADWQTKAKLSPSLQGMTEPQEDGTHRARGMRTVPSLWLVLTSTSIYVPTTQYATDLVQALPFLFRTRRSMASHTHQSLTSLPYPSMFRASFPSTQFPRIRRSSTMHASRYLIAPLISLLTLSLFAVVAAPSYVLCFILEPDTEDI